MPTIRDIHRFHRSVRILLWAACVGVGAGCGASDTQSWDEEVKLLDGRVIVISQTRRIQRAHTGPGIASNIEREAWIRFSLPETNGKKIEWHEALIPMRFDVVHGNPYIVGYPATAMEFVRYGRPAPPYLAFKYIDGSWKRVSFDAIPKEIYDANLVIKRGRLSNIKLLTLTRKESVEFNKSLDVTRVSKTIVPDFRVPD